MRITVAHASTPAAGEVENGDKAIYRAQNSVHLLAVVDGLGHGVGAHEASTAAEEYLSTANLEQPLGSIMEGVHDALARTRGAAATICLFRPGRLEACAVGNVELRSGRLRIPLVASPGVLGSRVARFRICEARVEVPSRLILFSDGFSARVRFEEHSALSPQELCHHTMSEHRRDYDDCTILVADIEVAS